MSNAESAQTRCLREVKVSPLKSVLTQIRIVHAAFVTTWFLFLLVIYRASPNVAQRAVPTVTAGAIALVSVTVVGMALYFRSQNITPSLEVLRVHPEDVGALAKWRAGNVLSFTFAETTTLFGLALKFMGADWKIAGPFFAVGLLLLLAWFPRLDFDLPN
jgi:hypothetical protein